VISASSNTLILKREGILFVMVGPTGCGKSTFCNRLVGEFSDSLQYSVSATTRAPRANEDAGRSYHFMDRDEFIKRRSAGEFFEWEEIHGNLYGTLNSNLIAGIESGRDLVFQIDIKGALNFKRQFPNNTITVFILPPSFNELQERLKDRGTVDADELRRRFLTAREEYERLLSEHGERNAIDYLVVNGDLELTYQQIRSIVISERARYHRLDLEAVRDFVAIRLEPAVKGRV
jgi:guanylate kinase